MKEITKKVKVKVFKYDELSEESKSVVRDILAVEIRQPHIFQEFAKEQIESILDIENTEVSFSLGYSQGDGLNFSGIITFATTESKLFLKSILDENKNFTFSKLEYLYLCTQIEKIEITHNDRYMQSCNSDIEIVYKEEEPNNSVLQMPKEWVSSLKGKFAYVFETWYNRTCLALEKIGYEYFYEIPIDEIEEFSQYYYENGTPCFEV